MSHSVIVEYQGLRRAVKYGTKMRSPSPFVFLVFLGPDGRRMEKSSKACTLRRTHEVAPAVIQEVYTEAGSPPPVPWDEAWRLLEGAARASNVRPGTLALYKLVMQSLRDTLPGLKGPAEVTDRLARQYKALRAAKVTPSTLEGNLRILHALYKKWWVKECGVCCFNPFEGVEMPHVDAPKKRVLTEKEERDFLDWLLATWVPWRLPWLFVSVKAAIGCRNLDLASAETSWLRDGRLCFPAGILKGRHARDCRLPPGLYAELLRTAGKTYVWESFPDELRRRYRPQVLKMIPQGFKPGGLIKFLQKQVTRYVKQSGVPRFTLHSLRGTAMSRYLAVGGDYQSAAIAFGCHPQVMRRHYASFSETDIADRVLESIQKGRYA